MPKPEIQVKNHSYQPSKSELSKIVSVSTSPERLVKALMKGGAARRKEKAQIS